MKEIILIHSLFTSHILILKILITHLSIIHLRLNVKPKWMSFKGLGGLKTQRNLQENYETFTQLFAPQFGPECSDHWTTELSGKHECDGEWNGCSGRVEFSEHTQIGLSAPCTVSTSRVDMWSPKNFRLFISAWHWIWNLLPMLQWVHLNFETNNVYVVIKFFYIRIWLVKSE